MVRHSVIETYDNDDHFDLVYIIFVWVSYKYKFFSCLAFIGTVREDQEFLTSLCGLPYFLSLLELKLSAIFGKIRLQWEENSILKRKRTNFGHPLVSLNTCGPLERANVFLVWTHSHTHPTKGET